VVPADIGDYALLGDTQTAALVSRAGSVDWLCLPRFDSPACFAALLGGPQNGRWLVAPAAPAVATRRRYRDDTLVLETDYQTADGAVTVVDAMAPPSGDGSVKLIRLVTGRGGRVPMRMELAPRFGYGRHAPDMEHVSCGLRAVSGPDSLCLSTPAGLAVRDGTAHAAFTVTGRQQVPFTLIWQPSRQDALPLPDPEHVIAKCERWWRLWASQCSYDGQWRPAVIRSLLTLKALTYAPTGAIMAAATTSLPEAIGGTRNWDYRYCWLRDAALTITVFNDAGYPKEALEWREWLLRIIAGDPAGMQIVYGAAGERQLPEWEASWLPGHRGSVPVRIGNAATSQFQLDVYGEIADAQYALARQNGLSPGQQQVIVRNLRNLGSAWQRPDHGIWEIRGPRRHFTYSKVMAWVAFDRAARLADLKGLAWPTRRWRALASQIRAEVLSNGYDPRRNTFTQSYGSAELDASLLRLPAVGFLPASDPRISGTVAAIRRELSLGDSLLLRYPPTARGSVDGISEDEGAFLAGSFWLADAIALAGHRDEASRLFDRHLELTNDLGLLAEQYDPSRRQQVGNFPQALSHLALAGTAMRLDAMAQSPPGESGAMRRA
jgi:GH15 family glucan-1,4-alpha-glucosidase